MAIQINANGDIHRLLHNLSFTADMVMDGVQENHSVDGLQRPLLPLPGDGWANFIGDPADGAV